MGLLLTDRAIFSRIDYSFLLTFVGFFIFIGNMDGLPQFTAILQQIVSGNEVLVGIASSQVILSLILYSHQSLQTYLRKIFDTTIALNILPFPSYVVEKAAARCPCCRPK